MIGEMMAVLLGLPQSHWDAYAFQNSTGCVRLSASQRGLLAQGARQEAAELAQRKREQFGERLLTDVLAAHGLSVQDMPPTQWGTKIPFAYFEEPSSVYLNRDLAQACQNLLEQTGFAGIFGGIPVEEVLLAHELYHFCAGQGEAPYARQEHLRLWKLGPFEARRRISALEELGAMAFAEEYCSLGCSPFVLDVPLTYCCSPEQAQKLYDRILGLRQIIEEESP